MNRVHLAGAPEMICTAESAEQMSKPEANDDRHEHGEKFEICHLFLFSILQLATNTKGNRGRYRIFLTASVTVWLAAFFIQTISRPL